MIYNYILITDADISLRSVFEMRTQVSPGRGTFNLSIDIWRYMGLPNWLYLHILTDGMGALPVDCAPRFTLVQNSAILSVSRRINQEATYILCAKNKFHYSCMRSFPRATVDLLENSPWPMPFSGMQLYFMRSLSLDYCNSHYHHWTDAAVNDIDNCMARNIIHISKSCPSLKTFSPYIFSRPPLTPQFHGRLGTGQAALALKGLRKCLDWLNIVSTLPDSAVGIFGQTITPGAVWQVRQQKRGGLPKVTISKWQLAGVSSRRYTIRVLTLDCKNAMENEEAENGDAGSEDAENGES